MLYEVDILPDSELLRIARTDSEHSAKIRKLYSQAYSTMLRERQRIEAGLSDLAQRGGALMAVAGLIALMPLPETGNTWMVWHMLVFVHPFLFLAILSFLVGSIRLHLRISEPSLALEDTEFELLLLKEQHLAARDLCKSLEKIYKRSLVTHRITTISVFLFLLAFCLHYGWFLKTESLMSVNGSIIWSIILVITGLVFTKILYFSRSDEDRLMGYGGEPQEQNVSLGRATLPWPEEQAAKDRY